MPPFDIVHAVTPYSEHTLREHLHTIHETALRTTLVDENIFFQKSFLSRLKTESGEWVLRRGQLVTNANAFWTLQSPENMSSSRKCRLVPVSVLNYAKLEPLDATGPRLKNTVLH